MHTLIRSRPARLMPAALAGALILLLMAGSSGRVHADDPTRGGGVGLGPMLPGGKPLQGSQPFAILMCKFKDVAEEPRDVADIKALFGIGAGGSTMGSQRPSIDHYWREVSYNSINLDGSKVFDWITLPEGEAAYRMKDAGGNPIPSPLDPTRWTQDFDKLARDCTAAAEAQLNPNFDAFKGINMFFNGELDGRSGGRPNDHVLEGKSRKQLPTSWFTPEGSGNPATIVHEMGHAFGLNHSSGPYNEIYDSKWDLMSEGRVCPGDGSGLNLPFGCEAAHPIAAYKDYLGWIPAARKYKLAAGDRAIVKLARLAQPGSSGMLLAKVPIPGSTTQFYTVEMRQDVGYDVVAPGGPGGGVVIHKVNTTLKDRNAQVVDADGNGDPNDGGATWFAGETFTDAANNIMIRVNSVKRDDGTAVLTLENKPAITISDVTVSEPSPPTSTAQARFTVRLSQATSKSVGLDYFTTAGTATKNVDYVHAEGHLSIPSGATSATITVNVKLDTVTEQNETFFVNLKNPIGASLSDTQAKGTITDRIPTAPTPAPCPPPGTNCQEK